MQWFNWVLFRTLLALEYSKEKEKNFYSRFYFFTMWESRQVPSSLCFLFLFFIFWEVFKNMFSIKSKYVHKPTNIDYFPSFLIQPFSLIWDGHTLSFLIYNLLTVWLFYILIAHLDLLWSRIFLFEHFDGAIC